MTRAATLAHRIREVLLNGKWIANTNFKEQLQATGWQQAVQQVQDLNTIALLTFHINYYLKGLLQVFNGGPLDISDKYSFDLPPIVSEAGWQQLAQEFLQHAEVFAAVVEAMDDTGLDQPFVKDIYGTNARNIEAVIEHSYYHLGQVTLIGKLIRQQA